MLQNEFLGWEKKHFKNFLFIRHTLNNRNQTFDLLSELRFYKELSVIKTDQAFKGYE